MIPTTFHFQHFFFLITYTFKDIVGTYVYFCFAFFNIKKERKYKNSYPALLAI